MSNTTSVFAIPELLTMILKHLSTTELIVAQGVNKTWRDIIVSSKDYRKVVLLEAVRLYTWEGWLDQNYKWNPTPVLRKLAPNDLNPTHRTVRPYKMHQINTSPGPWNKMFLTQPPIKEIEVCVKMEKSDAWQNKILSVPSGITFADVGNVLIKGFYTPFITITEAFPMMGLDSEVQLCIPGRPRPFEMMGLDSEAQLHMPVALEPSTMIGSLMPEFIFDHFKGLDGWDDQWAWPAGN